MGRFGTLSFQLQVVYESTTHLCYFYRVFTRVNACISRHLAAWERDPPHSSKELWLSFAGVLRWSRSEIPASVGQQSLLWIGIDSGWLRALEASKSRWDRFRGFV